MMYVCVHIYIYIYIYKYIHIHTHVKDLDYDEVGGSIEWHATGDLTHTTHYAVYFTSDPNWDASRSYKLNNSKPTNQTHNNNHDSRTVSNIKQINKHTRITITTIN